MWVTHSNIEGFGYLDLGGNINSDPLFIDMDGPDNILGTFDDNFQLQANSPCVDTGTNAGITSTVDIDGRVRILDGDCDGSSVVDMGAYEYKSIAGDVNDTCSVDINDVISFSYEWLEKDCAPCNGADLDLDGDVTLLDLSILSADWLKGI